MVLLTIFDLPYHILNYILGGWSVGGGVLRLPHYLKSSLWHTESSSISNLEKVLSVDGEQVAQIAAGTEHSALVTGKMLFQKPKQPHT
jgi:hypothetical protein